MSKGMKQPIETTLRIVIHPTGNALTMQQEGRIVDARAFKPGRLWEELAQGGRTVSLSFAYCTETCQVLKEEVRLRGRG
jgi:hypothetical protein